MPVEVLLDDWFELVQELQLGQVLRHGPSSYLEPFGCINLPVYSSNSKIGALN